MGLDCIWIQTTFTSNMDEKDERALERHTKRSPPSRHLKHLTHSPQSLSPHRRSPHAKSKRATHPTTPHSPRLRHSPHSPHSRHSPHSSHSTHSPHSPHSPLSPARKICPPSSRRQRLLKNIPLSQIVEPHSHERETCVENSDTGTRTEVAGTGTHPSGTGTQHGGTGMVRRIVFSGSWPEVSQLPILGAPEVAFVGRSNVGKSSLINSLFSCFICKDLAHVSKTPGRTRMINKFDALTPRGKKVCSFIDLPGYGYARGNRVSVRRMHSATIGYLAHRRHLTLTALLVDSSIDPQERDRRMVERLRAFGRRFIVIATKTDKSTDQHRQDFVESLRSVLGLNNELVVPVSCRTKDNISLLWKVISDKLKGE
eukprot:GHVN01009060.1.p1 GENE.GHVN01009060.1~~GHVN01009060.1.p1  ORF type:complete len:393 (-),score=129.17 GHVN01009060.1:88-1197(-)